MKKKKEEKSNSLLDALNQINLGNPSLTDSTDKYKIVDIMTFCDSPELLNLPGTNFNLWLPQRIILKSFYMGTRGNENLKLTQEEWQWLYDNSKNEEREGVIYEKNMGEVIDKLQRKERDGFNFYELHLVLGRRASKTILASVISAYEAYKLIKIGNGNPHRFYGMPDGEDISIINVALSQDQAGKLFGHIETRITKSPFFKDRMAKRTTTEIRLYTDEDLKSKMKDPNAKGSIQILCGHSDPKTLRGSGAVLILFDELAFYDESGKTPGSAFYNSLEPSTKKFKKFGDGRLVEISSPNSTVGIFYDIFDSAKTTDHILSYQLPTWCVNMDIPYESMAEERKRNIGNFIIEYGAQWAKGGVYGKYFDDGLVDRCIVDGLVPHTRPEPGYNYYLHVDPANGGDRYVALLVGKRYYSNHMGQKRSVVSLANMWIWEPQKGVGLIFNHIDRDVIAIAKAFHVLAVSYDQWNSEQSLQLLRANGINVSCISYNRNFKMKIYQNLTDMMSYPTRPELLLYNDNRLISEMKALRKKATMRGMSLTTDKHGDVKTDDLVDSLAGAVAMASENVRPSLPLPVTCVFR